MYAIRSYYARRRLRLDSLLLQGDDQAGASQLLGVRRPRDAEEPGREARVAAELRQRLPRLAIGLLDEVGGLLGVAGQAVAGGVKLAVRRLRQPFGGTRPPGSELGKEADLVVGGAGGRGSA